MSDGWGLLERGRSPEGELVPLIDGDPVPLHAVVAVRTTLGDVVGRMHWSAGRPQLCLHLAPVDWQEGDRDDGAGAQASLTLPWRGVWVRIVSADDTPQPLSARDLAAARDAS